MKPLLASVLLALSASASAQPLATVSMRSAAVTSTSCVVPPCSTRRVVQGDTLHVLGAAESRLYVAVSAWPDTTNGVGLIARTALTLSPEAEIRIEGSQAAADSVRAAAQARKDNETRRRAALGLSEVAYILSGSANRASVTYETPRGTEQHDVRLPWTHRADFRPGEFVYVSAQNRGERGGITVELRINGRLVEESTSSVAYGIASADGVTPGR